MSNEINQNAELAGIINEAIRAKESSFLDGFHVNSEAIVHAPGLQVRILKDEERKESNQHRIRPRGRILVDDLESFIAAVKAEEHEHESAIFVSHSNSLIEAVINHGSMASEAGGQGWGWADRRISYKVKQSRQLTEWLNRTKATDQVEFAEFLEDHARDVMQPSSADIQEIVLELEATKEGICKSRVNMANGSMALQFSDEVHTSVELPRQITLIIPLYDGGPATTVKANFRLRIIDQRPKFALSFPGLQDLLRDGFDQFFNELEAAGLQSLILAGNCPE
jgi:uncharacterized protein YfdQ (DUF2303 family)